jgi:putative N-acetylmannosamine-6-phosphate epimerase
MATADNLVQRFENIDFRITTELMQETDALIQRVTNLISIDEGYRSRDQNESIRRLTWITVSEPSIECAQPAL